VRGLAGTKPLDAEAFFSIDTDVFVPAALAGSITAPRARAMRASILLELANGPTTPEADRVFAERDVLVIPDILANAGGVVVSYYEWVQAREGRFWSESEVLEALSERMLDAYGGVRSRSKDQGITLRQAAFDLALLRVIRALEARDQL
jgi:glutamate dehydrogenase (NAD(P)+)